MLRKALSPLGLDGLDWQSGVKREFEIPGAGLDERASSALAQIASAYGSVLSNPSALSSLQRMIAGAPQTLRDFTPNPQRVLAEKQDLAERRRQLRSLLQRFIWALQHNRATGDWTASLLSFPCLHRHA